jgi:ElaB/YqjD/DUF883 family membrane-anchored ribosome-binding protein
MEDPDLIREQIEQTRSSLTDKLETLEDRVTTTVQEASKTVENVTGSVEETVATVTDSVQETVETVKDTVEETLSVVKDGVNAVKSVFDIPRHVDRHPWVAVGGSLAVGYVLGEILLPRPARADRNHEPVPRLAAGVSSNGNGQHHNGTETGAAHGGGLLEQFEPELTKLKGLALGVLMGTLREVVAKAAGDHLGQSVSEIIDSVTEKIGGTPVPHDHLVNMQGKQRESSDDIPYASRAEPKSDVGEPAAMSV